MISHPAFTLIACLIILLWAVASAGYLPPLCRRRFPLGPLAFAAGWLVLASFLLVLWITLQRVPMRTIGETRLWYTCCLAAIGLCAEWRWRTRMLALPTLVLALVFLLLVLVQPEALDKTQMPALRSPWFAPHVIACIAAYACFGIAAAVSAWALGRRLCRRPADFTTTAGAVSQLIMIGIPLLTTGLIFGACWAKDAWGNYWSWDPKETFALAAWACYLIYLHLERTFRLRPVSLLVLSIAAFSVALACWFGINLLPSAAMSVHAYTNN